MARTGKSYFVHGIYSKRENMAPQFLHPAFSNGTCQTRINYKIGELWYF